MSILMKLGILVYLSICIAVPVAQDNGPYVQDETVQDEWLSIRADVPPGYVAAPYYPTPLGGWIPEWQDSYEAAAKLVRQMTLVEKVNLTSGTGFLMGRCAGMTGSAARLGIPQLCLQDGALGVRATDHITVHPAGISAGAAFDKRLALLRGRALGADFRAKGAHVHLGPTVGPLGRKPRGGRGWEGFGADAALQAKLGAQHVRGVQAVGVVATVKHLIANEQEVKRMKSPLTAAYSANVGDRTLREVYLWPFAEVVRAGVGAVMTSYNMVNGSAASQNSLLINGILKDELGFQGFVMSDWLSQDSGVGSALAGLDMAMPGDTEIPLFGTAYWAYELSRSVLNGTVPVSRLDDMVTRIVASWIRMGQNKNYPEPNFSVWTSDATGKFYPGALFSPSGVVNEFVQAENADENNQVALDVARESITLLKNDGNLLPLSKNRSLYLFGTDQAWNPDGLNACGDKGCDKGTLGMGWGSGSASYPNITDGSTDDPATAIKKVTPSAQLFNTDTFPSGLSVSKEDVAIVFINADSGEGYITVENNQGDRTADGLNAWHNGNALVQAAAASFSQVVVVAHTVGPIIVEPWIDLPSVKAVLFAHLPGQSPGKPLADVLFGKAYPCGHLPYSIPRNESDYPSSVSIEDGGIFDGQVQDTFEEGLFIDYKHLLSKGIMPRYAFGHGLDYTDFTFESVALRRSTPLTRTTPPRQSKAPTVQSKYNTSIPPGQEAAWPKGFSGLDRYLYPYLNQGDIDGAIADQSKTYPYPNGYSTKQKPGPPAGGGLGGNPALWTEHFSLSATVRNRGSRFSGKASVQAYLQFPPAPAALGETPLLQLRDFEKTSEVRPGGAASVRLSFSRKDFSVWDTRVQNWIIPGKGDGSGFKVWVGKSSVDLQWVCDVGNGTCRKVRAGEVKQLITASN